MHSSLKIAKYSIYLFWIGLFLNIIVLLVIVYRLFVCPGVSSAGDGPGDTSGMTPGMTSGDMPEITPGMTSVDTPGIMPFSIVTNSLNYTVGFIGSSRSRRPFFNESGRMLTIGDVWEYGRILTITPYRIISSISPTEFFITQYERPVKLEKEQSNLTDTSLNVPELFTNK